MPPGEFFPDSESGRISLMRIFSRGRFGIGLLASCCLLALTQSQAAVPRSPGAQRVFDVLDRLRLAAAQPKPSAPRSLTITDADLNDYITYRILSEKEEILRDLHLKVFPDNRVEGMMFLDLTKIGAPSFLRPNLHFYFSGRLMSQEGRIKFEVRELFLEFKPVPVFLLDIAFYIASKTQKHGPAGLAEWYKLPLGIRDIVTQEGRIIFTY